MDCAEFEKRLGAYQSGSLGADRSQAAQTHLGICPRCRTLARIACGQLDVMPAETREQAVQSILRHTTGPVCGKVRELLCDEVDHVLGGASSELLRLHLDHCSGCRSLAEALAMNQEVLPQMTFLDPGEGFVERVLQATVARHREDARRPRPALRWWRNWTMRPRFAVEAAYLATLILLLVVGNPAGPIRNLTPVVHAAVQDAPARAWQLAREHVTDNVMTQGHTVWSRYRGWVRRLTVKTAEAQTELSGIGTRFDNVFAAVTRTSERLFTMSHRSATNLVQRLGAYLWSLISPLHPEPPTPPEITRPQSDDAHHAP